MKIIADRAIPFIEDVLTPYADVIRLDGDAFTADIVRDADALIIRTRTKCNKALLEGSRVQFIATATIGFDHIDLDYCRTHNIAVSTAAGCNARGVLQWVSAALALLARRDGFSPEERTLGIVGVGNVGSLVKEYAEAWGFRTICCDPPREERERLGFVDLESLLSQSDIVTLHVPLDSTTRHLINRTSLAALRHGATIINASRGEVASTEALLRDDLTCLIDVWENEPNLDPRLLDKALVATTHIAGYSAQGKANASALSIRALARHFGLPLTDWYPSKVTPSQPRPILWQTMLDTIADHCDLATESRNLKANADHFEAIRNHYNYREEYF